MAEIDENARSALQDPPVTNPNAKMGGGDPAALFVTDIELIRRLGVPERTARMAIRELERRSGFPRKDPLFGGRRFWPAVTAYLAKRYGIGTLSPSAPDGLENFDAIHAPADKAR
jgi:hypothetical protein